jgi:TIR domain-containing protein
MASSIFISYRRGAAAGTAGRLYDVFSARFGDEHVFMDVDSIHPGDDFVEILTQTLDRCQAMVVVIDPSWLVTTGPAGQRRLDEPGDYVRLEIERALNRSIRVFPALIDNARMPTPDDLPPTISRLAHRQAVEISSTRFKYDAGRLLSAIERVVDTPLSSEQHDTRQPLAQNRRVHETQGPHHTARDHAQAVAKPHGLAPTFGRSRTIRTSLEDTWGGSRRTVLISAVLVWAGLPLPSC